MPSLHPKSPILYLCCGLCPAEIDEESAGIKYTSISTNGIIGHHYRNIYSGCIFILRLRIKSLLLRVYQDFAEYKIHPRTD